MPFLPAAAVVAAALQQADVIRGRVVGEDGRPIENATVQATSIPNNVARTARAMAPSAAPEPARARPPRSTSCARSGCSRGWDGRAGRWTCWAAARA